MENERQGWIRSIYKTDIFEDLIIVGMGRIKERAETIFDDLIKHKLLQIK